MKNHFYVVLKAQEANEASALLPSDAVWCLLGEGRLGIWKD